VVSVKRELVRPSLRDVGGRMVTPLDAAVEILKKLKRDAETGLFHREITRAVITCPAAFDQLERDKIAEAGQRAGFREVELLEEPVAAAMAYARAGLDVGRSVLVYDLGGGTFDLALLVRDEDGEFRLAMEPRGLRCGGDDLDRALYDYLDQAVRQRANRTIGTGGVDLAFLRACRQRKEALSVRETCDLRALLPGTNQPVTKTLKREWFESLIEEQVEPTIRLTRDLVEEARLSGCPVESVVLIGGSSRIPLVAQKLKEALPIEPKRWQHQDVAVALGAAYHGSRLWGHQPARPAPPVPRPSLVILQGPDAGRQFACDAETITIGRQPDCGVCLESPAVSRHHARIIRDGGQYFVEDLSGINGTFLNGDRVRVRQLLSEDDTLQIGPYRLALRPTSPRPESVASPQANVLAPDRGVHSTAPPREPAAEAQTLLSQAVTLLKLVRGLNGAGSEGTQHAGQQRLADSLRTVQAACDLEPNWPDAFHLKGAILQERGEWRLAAASYTACLRISPDHAEAYGDRGFCKLMMGDHAGARQDLTDAIRLSPKEATFRRRGVACLRADDVSAALADFREALTRVDQDTPVAALHATMGFLWQDAFQSPEHAVDAFAEALKALPKTMGAAEQHQFTRACELLGIAGRVNLINPIPSVQHALWLACMAVHGGCTRPAVMLFHSRNRHAIDTSVWQSDPLFAVYSAGIQARAFKNVPAVLWWLYRLLAVQPAFDIRVASRDPDIARLQDERIRAFFQPKWSFEETHGMLWNFLKVTNLSPFCLTSVVVTVTEDRTDGKTTPPRQLRVPAINASEGLQWDKVFPDGGFFGVKIRRVNFTLTCAESEGQGVQAAALDTPAVSEAQRSPLHPPGASRCPRCGVKYGWDGIQCRHCHHRS
jgi:actin-like ATPase involved in cell morphogenesis/tetratricopeptide (TPR) repeat protein